MEAARQYSEGLRVARLSALGGVTVTVATRAQEADVIAAASTLEAWVTKATSGLQAAIREAVTQFRDVQHSLDVGDLRNVREGR